VVLPVLKNVGMRGYNTPALTPGIAGPWMWPAVEFTVRPEKVMLSKVRSLPESESVPDPLPCRAPPPSWSGVREIVKLWAWAAPSAQVRTINEAVSFFIRMGNYDC
jgi:hypothetical protein